MTAEELTACDQDLSKLEALARTATLYADLLTAYAAAERFYKKWTTKLDADTSDEARALIQRFGEASEIAEKAHGG